MKIPDNVVEELKQITPAQLEARGLIRKSERGERKEGHGYCCVYCNSGNGQNKSGALNFDYKDGLWKHNCFACGEGGDNIKLFKTVFNADFADACKQAADTFNIPLDGNYSTPRPQWKPPAPPPPADNSEELELIRADLATPLEPLKDFVEAQGGQWRGLSAETLLNFHCRYIPKWIHPKFRLHGYKEKIPAPSRRVIIPAGDHYNAVALPADRSHIRKAFWKMHAGKKTLFNSDALTGAAQIIPVVEGEFDAMSLWQASNGEFPAVALTGAGEMKKLLAAIDRLKPVGKEYLILLDGDLTGRDNAPKLRDALLAINCPAVVRFLDDFLSSDDKRTCADTNGKIDANGILQSKGDEFLADLLKTIADDARADFDTARTEIERRKEAAATEPPTDSERPSTGRRLDDETKAELDDAINFIETLTQETFTAELATDRKTIGRLAHLRAFGHSEVAETFFTMLKQAQAAARNRLRDAAAQNRLSEVADDMQALLNLSAKAIRESVTYQTRELKKDAKQRELNAQADRARARHAARKKEVADNLAELDDLQEQYRQEPTAELLDEIRRLILNSCDAVIDRYTGEIDRLKSTAANAQKIFELDPILNGLFAFDEFRQYPVFLKRPPWKKRMSEYEQWEDKDDDELRNYLRTHYADFGGQELVRINFTHYANQNSFHEVHEYFKNLPAWDGTERAATLFVDFLRVDDTPFTREVTLNWLTAAVARIFHPGCRYHTALVLQGKQGIGKSYVLERLGGKWHTELIDSVDDPHAVDTLQNSWIVEMKEMAAARKADINAAKSFLERSSDNRRRAFERRAVDVKRHVVFAITVNDNQFLADQTGNRRYVVLECHNKARQYVSGLTDEYIAQVWAEVFARCKELFKPKFDERKLELSAETQCRADAINEQFTRDDGLKSEIEAFLEVKIPPPQVWQIMTKEERRKFITDRNVFFYEDQLRTRFGTLPDHIKARYPHGVRAILPEISEHGGKIEVVPDDEGLYKSIIFTPVSSEKDKSRQDQKPKLPRFAWTFYGTVQREHICAGEIYTECFGNDRRKTMTRISEALAQLDGWHKGARLRNEDTAYADQKIVYYRT